MFTFKISIFTNPNPLSVSIYIVMLIPVSLIERDYFLQNTGWWFDSSVLPFCVTMDAKELYLEMVSTRIFCKSFIWRGSAWRGAYTYCNIHCCIGAFDRSFDYEYLLWTFPSLVHSEMSFRCTIIESIAEFLAASCSLRHTVLWTVIVLQHCLQNPSSLILLEFRHCLF